VAGPGREGAWPEPAAAAGCVQPVGADAPGQPAVDPDPGRARSLTGRDEDGRATGVRVLVVVTLVAGLPAVLVTSAEPAPAEPAASSSAPIGEAGCAVRRPSSWRATTGTPRTGAPLRVFAIQFKQDLDHVVTYATFRRTMRCLVHELVEPYRRPGQPTLVVFPEDVGLATLATGRRGRTTRALATTPLGAPAATPFPRAASLRCRSWRSSTHPRSRPTGRCIPMSIPGVRCCSPRPTRRPARSPRPSPTSRATSTPTWWPATTRPASASRTTRPRSRCSVIPRSMTARPTWRRRVASPTAPSCGDRTTSTPRPHRAPATCSSPTRRCR